MDYREMMGYAPKDCKPTIIDPSAERKKQLEEAAQKLNKKVDELTQEEREEATSIPALDDPCDAFRD